MNNDNCVFEKVCHENFDDVDELLHAPTRKEESPQSTTTHVGFVVKFDDNRSFEQKR